MRKKVLCLVMTGAVMAGTMTVGTGTTVYAEDFTSQGDWSVTFNGDGMESSFSSQEMADEIYGILPGDSIEIKGRCPEMTARKIRTGTCPTK